MSSLKMDLDFLTWEGAYPVSQLPIEEGKPFWIKVAGEAFLTDNDHLADGEVYLAFKREDFPSYRCRILGEENDILVPKTKFLNSKFQVFNGEIYETVAALSRKFPETKFARLGAIYPKNKELKIGTQIEIEGIESNRIGMNNLVCFERNTTMKIKFPFDWKGKLQEVEERPKLYSSVEIFVKFEFPVDVRNVETQQEFTILELVHSKPHLVCYSPLERRFLFLPIDDTTLTFNLGKRIDDELGEVHDCIVETVTNDLEMFYFDKPKGGGEWWCSDGKDFDDQYILPLLEKEASTGQWHIADSVSDDLSPVSKDADPSESINAGECFDGDELPPDPLLSTQEELHKMNDRRKKSVENIAPKKKDSLVNDRNESVFDKTSTMPILQQGHRPKSTWFGSIKAKTESLKRLRNPFRSVSVTNDEEPKKNSVRNIQRKQSLDSSDIFTNKDNTPINRMKPRKFSTGGIGNPPIFFVRSSKTDNSCQFQGEADEAEDKQLKIENESVVILEDYRVTSLLCPHDIPREPPLPVSKAIRDSEDPEKEEVNNEKVKNDVTSINERPLPTTPDNKSVPNVSDRPLPSQPVAGAEDPYLDMSKSGGTYLDMSKLTEYEKLPNQEVGIPPPCMDKVDELLYDTFIPQQAETPPPVPRRLRAADVEIDIEYSNVPLIPKREPKKREEKQENNGTSEIRKPTSLQLEEMKYNEKHGINTPDDTQPETQGNKRASEDSSSSYTSSDNSSAISASDSFCTHYKSIQEVPSDVRELTVDQLANYLSLCNLIDIAQKVKDFQIDGKSFTEDLTEEDFAIDPFFASKFEIKRLKRIQQGQIHT